MTWYVTRPREVEAFVFTGGMEEPGWPDEWLKAPHVFERGGRTLVLKTKEGDKKAKKGDFVVKDPLEHPAKQFTVVPAGVFLAIHEEKG